MSLAEAYRAARAHRSGGFLFTKHLSDRLGSPFAALAMRFGIHPSVVTLIDLVIAVGASVPIITEVDQAQQWWLPGLIAFACWQFAYILDCTDGQMARATGKKSDFGGRLDVLVDFMVHLAVICALLTVIGQWSDVPIPLIVTCATLWSVNQLICILGRTDSNIGHSFTKSGYFFEILKTVRDTGFLLFVVGLWLFVDPKSLIYPVVTITAFNGMFLLASIGREAYLSMCGTTAATKVPGQSPGLEVQIDVSNAGSRSCGS